MLNKVILALCLSLMVICSWLKPIDLTATQQIDSGFKRALISFASARALNAAISVVQGTELAFEPGGIGINTTPGQLLDPINDLVEEFSTLMLAATVAFGVQKILISIGAYWVISLALTVVSIGWVWLHFRQGKPPEWLSRILIVLLMIRFAIPVVTIGTDFLFNKFMADTYSYSLKIITSASSQTDEIKPPVLPEEDGFFGILNDLKGMWTKAKATADFTDLKNTAEDWADHIINLIVIFLLQTLVIPLLLVWALYAVVKGAFELPVKISETT